MLEVEGGALQTAGFRARLRLTVKGVSRILRYAMLGVKLGVSSWAKPQ